MEKTTLSVRIAIFIFDKHIFRQHFDIFEYSDLHTCLLLYDLKLEIYLRDDEFIYGHKDPVKKKRHQENE